MMGRPRAASFHCEMAENHLIGLHRSTLSGATRRLVELGLTVKTKSRRWSEDQKIRAREMAGTQSIALPIQKYRRTIGPTASGACSKDQKSSEKPASIEEEVTPMEGELGQVSEGVGCPLNKRTFGCTFYSPKFSALGMRGSRRRAYVAIAALQWAERASVVVTSVTKRLERFIMPVISVASGRAA
jgi:hypothetical protein